MNQIIEQTHEEKIAMYMKLSKKELVSMVIEGNKTFAVLSSGPILMQKCPKCDGQDIVSKPSWIPGDQHTWDSTSASHQCDVCAGQKIIPRG